MRRSLTRLELCLWCVGLLCVAILLAGRLEARGARHVAQGLHPAAAPSSAAPTPNTGEASTAAKGVIGRLDVPSLRLSVPILDDDDPDSLREGVGRINGTAVPGGLGNLVLAGHRDTFFRPLRDVRPGMLMRVVTQAGTFDYLVDSTAIVLPADLDVMDIGNRPEMTLITCYPFHYIGAAPKRFIVHTHLVSVTGEPG